VVHHGYRLGVPRGGAYREALNTDSALYHGSNVGNQGRVTVEQVPSHERDQSVLLTLPPLAAVYLVPEHS
jgi:1,4-alpha-glucan branching enzyme